MRRTLPLLLALTTACASAPAPQPAPEATAMPAHAFSIREITLAATALTAQGQGDFEYRYALSQEGVLSFSAYYFNFPIHMNHNDRVEWNAGAHAEAVFAEVDALLADPARMAELCEVPDEGVTVERPCAESDAHGAPVYTFSLRSEGHASTWRATQPESASFQPVARAFHAMTEAFTAETHRPLSRDALPQ